MNVSGKPAILYPPTTLPQRSVIPSLRWLGSDRFVRMGLKPLVLALSLVPAVQLCATLVTDLNPFNVITRDTGYWSLRFLCFTLAVSPVRRLVGWHSLIKIRRMLGQFAFFYGTLHLLAYVVFYKYAALDLSTGLLSRTTAGDLLGAIGEDIVARPFIWTGFVAFAVMLPLALTSTRDMIRRLGGRRWQLLHRLIYVAAAFSVVHYRWPLFARSRTPSDYIFIVGGLLAIRLLPPQWRSLDWMLPRIRSHATRSRSRAEPRSRVAAEYSTGAKTG